MVTPNINANTQLELNDSCNCCFFRRRKRPVKKIDSTTEDIYQKVLREEGIPVAPVEETPKGSQLKDHSRTK